MAIQEIGKNHSLSIIIVRKFRKTTIFSMANWLTENRQVYYVDDGDDNDNVRIIITNSSIRESLFHK